MATVRPLPKPLHSSLIHSFDTTDSNNNSKPTHSSAPPLVTQRSSVNTTHNTRTPPSQQHQQHQQQQQQPAVLVPPRRNVWRQSAPAGTLSMSQLRKRFEANEDPANGTPGPKSSIRNRLHNALHHHHNTNTNATTSTTNNTTTNNTNCNDHSSLASSGTVRPRRAGTLGTLRPTSSQRVITNSSGNNNSSDATGSRHAHSWRSPLDPRPATTTTTTTPPRPIPNKPDELRSNPRSTTSASSSSSSSRDLLAHSAPMPCTAKQHTPSPPPCPSSSASSLHLSDRSGDEAFTPSTNAPGYPPPRPPSAQYHNHTQQRNSEPSIVTVVEPAPESPVRSNSLATLSFKAPAPSVPPRTSAPNTPRNHGSASSSGSGNGGGSEEFRMVLDELINTEATYVSDLVVFTDTWIKELLNRNLLSTTETSLIFSNINQIKQLNTQLLVSLTALGLTPLAQIDFSGISAFMEFLKLYAEYCTNYVTATERLEALQKHNSDLGATLEELRQRPESKQLDIYSFMIKPLQRLTKYPLLLLQLMKALPPSHAHYSSLKVCYDRITSVVGEINEKQRAAEERLKMLAVQTRFDLVVVVPFRKIVKIGQFRRVQVSNKKQPLKKCHIFLFTDGLLIAKEKSKRDQLIATQGRNKLICESGGVIPLAVLSVSGSTPSSAFPPQSPPPATASLSVHPVPVIPSSSPFKSSSLTDTSFTIMRLDTNDSFLVPTDSLSEKQEWITAIQDTCANVKTPHQSPSAFSSSSSSPSVQHHDNNNTHTTDHRPTSPSLQMHYLPRPAATT
eukprot:TRINITY_DN2527_c0_g1_i1.p1 TRINITY_DN2527_c0_g1~~TRINITY_DN2527_c0_g1_i1.p1  ORF type:complete len:787 (-),score=183.90 TRINITY_DN2527_c0_g1_i1:79-2439(-)